MYHSIVKDKLKKQRLSYIDNIILFNQSLTKMPSYIQNEYFNLSTYLNDIPYIYKETKYNKELYYFQNKLILNITLRNNKINYRFKNKYLLKRGNFRCLPLRIFPNPSLRSQKTPHFADDKMEGQRRWQASNSNCELDAAQGFRPDVFLPASKSTEATC